MGKKREERIKKAVERQKKNQRKKILIALAVISAIIIVIAGVDLVPYIIKRASVDEYIELYEKRIQALEYEIFQVKGLDDSLADSFEYIEGDTVYAAFISVTDTTDRANVITGTGYTLKDAWSDAVEKTEAYITRSAIKPVWVKADIVDSKEKISAEELHSRVRPFRSEFFRKGISLGTKFETAFLEAEINGNKLIDYDIKDLDLNTINGYLEYYNRDKVSAIPQDLLLFTCLGWFCDEDNVVYELYGYEGEGYDYGRRVLEEFNRDVIEETIISGTLWLQNEIKSDGAFIYGYYPTYDRQFTAYNLLRHAVSIQPLIWYYKMTGDEDIIPSVESTIKYLAEDHVVYKDKGVAYIFDRPNSEVKLGGNALAIITLELYMRTFETDRYKQLCIDLGHGILELMDPVQGTFFHVLYPDFTPKDEFRTVYYDGESAYALTLLYEMTGNSKWLEAAKAAVENFIREDYTRHRDHWVAYAMNEITRHYDNPEYFEFALRNVHENLDAIYHRDTSYHTYLELLMASYYLYDRIIENQIEIEYLDTFDDEYFIETIFKRAEHMLNGYFYPEYSMYLKNPKAITGTFMIRHDGYRLRIDDVEHFIAGYYNFWKNYDKLVEYRETLKD